MTITVVPGAVDVLTSTGDTSAVLVWVTVVGSAGGAVAVEISTPPLWSSMVMDADSSEDDWHLATEAKLAPARSKLKDDD